MTLDEPGISQFFFPTIIQGDGLAMPTNPLCPPPNAGLVGECCYTYFGDGLGVGDQTHISWLYSKYLYSLSYFSNTILNFI